MMQLANSPDGLPEPQAEIEKHLAKWFSEPYDAEPSESLLREFVVNHLPQNDRDE